jgi:hypothetical protein
MDIQRVDMGIAMCHFERTCQETCIPGAWTVQPAGNLNLLIRTSYVATWKPV